MKNRSHVHDNSDCIQRESVPCAEGGTRQRTPTKERSALCPVLLGPLLHSDCCAVPLLRAVSRVSHNQASVAQSSCAPHACTSRQRMQRAWRLASTGDVQREGTSAATLPWGQSRGPCTHPTRQTPSTKQEHSGTTKAREVRHASPRRQKSDDGKRCLPPHWMKVTRYHSIVWHTDGSQEPFIAICVTYPGTKDALGFPYHGVRTCIRPSGGEGRVVSARRDTKVDCLFVSVLFVRVLTQLPVVKLPRIDLH